MMRVFGTALVAATLSAGAAFAQDVELDGFEIAVGESGSIHLPDVDFRAAWTMLGAWSVAGEEGAEGMHVVYTQPETVRHYRETGVFPDGAVLIKELLAAKTEEMTTGTVSHATDPVGWFVMVKSAEPRFPDNALWGDGWGWAYFDPKDRTTTTTEDYDAECKTCHVPAEDTDWIYVRGYPVLNGQ